MRFVLIAVFMMSTQILAVMEEVQYKVRITNPHQHYAGVTVLFPETDAESLDITMPTWRLGRYQILELANGIRDFKVSDSAGKELFVSKINKSNFIGENI